MRNDNPVVLAVKEVFPGFDRSLWSKVQRPDTYGVQLVARAKLIADKAQKKRRRRDKHKGLSHTWRCGKELEQRLQTAREALGIITMQELITVAVMKFLEGMEEER